MLPSLFTPRYRFSNHSDSSDPFQNRYGNCKKSIAGRVESTAVKSESIKSIILVGSLLYTFKFLVVVVVCGGFVSVIYPQIEYQRVSKLVG